MSKQSAVETALLAGSHLIDTRSSRDNNAKDSSITRLRRYYDHENASRQVDESASIEEIQLTIAEESLSVVLRVQNILDSSADEEQEQYPTNSNADVPLIGTRDIAQLRTLLGITFKWGVESLLPRVLIALPKSTSKAGTSKIRSVDQAGQDFTRLSSILGDLLKLLFPQGPGSHLSQTLITTAILNKHLVDILKPAIVLGWMPKTLAIDNICPLHEVRPLVLRLLNILPPSQAILSLGTVISSLPSPPYIRRSASGLLTRQLLRPHGVRGLCEAVFGEEEAGDTEANNIDKLEHIAKLLTAVPKEMDTKGYYNAIVPKLVDLLCPSDPSAGQAPGSYKRAAAFTISRMIASQDHDGAAKTLILATIQDPFHFRSSPNALLSPSRCLTTLTIFVTNADPSPILISHLLSPIVPVLYSLQQHLEQGASDPTVLESVRGLLHTWARVVEPSECVGVLWSIVVGDEENGWLTDLEGNITCLPKSSLPDQDRLSIFTPQSLQEAEAAGDLNPDANLMEVYPDPARFVSFLERVGRSDAVAEMFVRCLEAYRAERKQEDPLKTLLYLQIVMQMQTRLEGGLLGLKDPGHILEFVKHALEDANQQKPSASVKPKDSLAALRIVDDDSGDDNEDGDSDDDMPDSERYDEMTETAINLLLSILEANPSLSIRSYPILDEIFDLLDGAPSSLNSLVREAKMVMAARLASSSTAAGADKPKDDTMERYQRALKLLQDPILPVRAHGLLLLRELKTPPDALIPAILEIFMEAIKDDESYIYLNGIQGLAGMVEKHGKQILTRLVGEFAKDLDGVWDQATLDKRVRIGEALGLVIKRCGQTLGAYVDLIVPQLMGILRSSGPPTTLKTSAVSLLGDCADTYLLALGSYWSDLIGAMLDLLQVETSQREDDDIRNGMDANPTKRDRFPPLRRAALHFVGLLVRETTRAVYEGQASLVLEAAVIRRAKLTLGYIASTDGDGVAKVMAREVNEGLGDLERAFIEYGLV